MKTITVQQAIKQGFKFGVTEDGDFMIRLDKLAKEKSHLEYHTLYVEQPEYSLFRISPKAIQERLEGYLEDQDEVNDEDDKLYDQMAKVDWEAVAKLVNEHFTTKYYYPDIDLQLIP